MLAACNHFFVHANISQFFENANIDDECLRKYIFDGNTITFLITLIVALLMGLVINSQKEIRDIHDKLKRAHDDVKLFEATKLAIEESYAISVKVESIYLEACIFRQVAFTHKQILTSQMMSIVYGMYKKTRSIITVIQEKNINTIPKSVQDALVETIDDSIAVIGFDKIYKEPKNKEDTEFLRDLEHWLNVLNKGISEMRVVE